MQLIVLAVMFVLCNQMDVSVHHVCLCMECYVDANKGLH